MNTRRKIIATAVAALTTSVLASPVLAQAA